MRLVHMTSSGELGGAESVALEILTHVRKAHPECRLQVLAPREGPLVRKVTAAGVDAQVIAFPPRFAATGEAGASAGAVVGNLVASIPALLGYLRRLRSTLRREGAGKPVIVHAHGFKAQVLAALASGRDVRVIWHVHDYVSSRPVSRRLLALLAPRTSLIIANSASVAADVQRVCPTSRVVPIYNGVDLDRFSPQGTALDLDTLGRVDESSAGTVRIGIVGMFGRWKGHAVLLHAIAQLRDVPLRAYVIGAQSYETAGSQVSEGELRQLATDLRISDRVVFTGAVEDVASAMRALDVVVHASTLPEPFGMVIAEAMACGRAVVVSHAGGAAELVEPQVDGLAHTPGDAANLADALRALIDDADLRSRLGAAARRTAERRFNAARVATELDVLYQQL